eukprot:758301-Amphidinium_carterae.1
MFMRQQRKQELQFQVCCNINDVDSVGPASGRDVLQSQERVSGGSMDARKGVQERYRITLLGVHSKRCRAYSR